MTHFISQYLAIYNHKKNLNFFYIIFLSYIFYTPSITIAEPITYQWKSSVDIPLIATIAIAGPYSQYQFQSLEPTVLNKLDKQKINLYDRWATSQYSPIASTISDISLVGMLVPLYLGWSYSQEQDQAKIFWIDALMYAEALLLSSSLNLWIRSIGSRPRPLVYNSSISLERRLRAESSSSFYSGHSSGAFLTAVFTSTLFQERYPKSPWVPIIWTGSLGLASTIAILRIFGGKHYPSDILAGALIGSIFGFGIPWLHKTTYTPSRYTLIPTLSTKDFHQTVGLLGILRF